MVMAADELKMRENDEEHSHGGPATVIILGVLSAIVNALKIWLLHADAMDSFNVRAVYIHLIADMFGSVATIVTGIWMACDEENHQVEPVATLIVGCILLINSVWVLAPTAQLLHAVFAQCSLFF